MRSIEIFSGVGGLAMGIADAGFKHEALIEWDRKACEVIRENKRRGHDSTIHWPLFEMDVRQFDFSRIPDGLDLVAGGPPCQPFSLGGKHRGYRDDRDMFPEAVRAVRELQPRAFLFENVRGILRQSFETYFEYILLQFALPEILRKPKEGRAKHYARLKRQRERGAYEGLSYRVKYHLLNAADYGVPQRRERVIVVGFRSDLGLDWSIPSPTHSQDALLWSQWISEDYWDKHGIRWKHRPEIPTKVRARVKRLQSTTTPPPGSPWTTVRDAILDLPEPQRWQTRINRVLNHTLNPGARSYPGHTGSLLDEPAKTLKAGNHGVPGGENMLVCSNSKVRYLTIRECARLQTFPDDYFFAGPWTGAMWQLGNAVPVKLSHVIATKIKDLLNENVLGQDNDP